MQCSCDSYGRFWGDAQLEPSSVSKPWLAPSDVCHVLPTVQEQWSGAFLVRTGLLRYYSLLGNQRATKRERLDLFTVSNNEVVVHAVHLCFVRRSAVLDIRDIRSPVPAAPGGATLVFELPESHGRQHAKAITRHSPAVHRALSQQPRQATASERSAAYL